MRTVVTLNDDELRVIREALAKYDPEGHDIERVEFLELMLETTTEASITYIPPEADDEERASVLVKESDEPGSTASTELMLARHFGTGDIYVIRVAHGGEANGEVSFPTGSRGPYRSNVENPHRLLAWDGPEFRTDALHLEWLETEQFERLDLKV